MPDKSPILDLADFDALSVSADRKVWALCEQIRLLCEDKSHSQMIVALSANFSMTLGLADVLGLAENARRAVSLGEALARKKVDGFDADP